MTFDTLKRWWQGKRRRGAGNRPSSDPAATENTGASLPPASLSKPSRSCNAQRSAPAGDAAATGRQPRPKARSGRPVSKRGIPILDPDEDLARCFLSSERFQGDADKSAARRGRPPASAPEEGVRKRRQGASGRPRRNRAGIRQLKSDDDVWRHFLAAGEAEEGAPPRERSAPADGRPAPPAAHVATDRHGIPRLDDHVDLHRFFEGSVREDQESDGLAEVFRRSLEQDARSLMKRKAGGVWEPRRLTLREQLRRYPAPQAQLDLHGATAPMARQRAESFIRAALADGLFTLRLIVGKGLHSEGGAVLPDVIEELLLALKRENLVLTYRWEKGAKRKSGAVIVYLPAGI